MEKPSLSKEIKVGIFAGLGLLLFCISIVLLGGDKFLLKRTYNLKVHLPQVQGLATGSVVSVSGLQVGNVEKINFLENTNDIEIVMKIEEDARKRITEGSIASVKTQGALGDKYVFIQPGPPNATPLKDNAEITRDNSPDLLDMIANKGAEFGEIIAVVREVRVLFENINKDHQSAKLMANMVQASGEFSKFMGEAKATFQLMRNDVFTPMSAVMKKIDNGQGTLGALINDPSLHNRISNFFGEAPRNRFLKPLIRESIETHEKK